MSPVKQEIIDWEYSADLELNNLKKIQRKRIIEEILSLLICTLISENHGVEKSRSVPNFRKF